MDGTPGDHHSLQQDWIREQDELRAKLVLEDDFSWSIPSPPDCSMSSTKTLRYIGGVDLSFSKDNPDIACAALVVLDLHNSLNVVYEAYNVIQLQVPYITGFLAFREAPILVKLLEDMKTQYHPFYPQVLMVDGNGILHPRGFGLACHLGVLVGLPTIGIGKNLHHVDGLNQNEVRQLLEDSSNGCKNLILLTGNSGRILGAAMRSNPRSSKPIFVSIGHRISLDSCIKVVRMCCKFRVPEPVRQADIRSRRWLQINHH